MFGYLFLVMQYMQLILGYSPNKTALALSPIMGPMLLLSVLSFWYLPWLGLRAVVFSGLLLIAAGVICLLGVTSGSPYWRAAWPMLVMSVGIGLCTAPTTSVIMTTAPDDKQGVASAVNDASREIGAALGIALAGSMLAAQYAKTLAPNLIGFPEIGERRRVDVAGRGAGGRAATGAGGHPTGRGQQDRVHRRHAFIAVGARRADRRQRRPDRTVGTGA